jgi:hypothetical protein
MFVIGSKEKEGIHEECIRFAMKASLTFQTGVRLEGAHYPADGQLLFSFRKG